MRSTFQSFFRVDRAVCLNIYNKFFVVSLLFNTGIFNAVFHILDRCEDCVDRNKSEYLLSWLIFFCRKIASAFLDSKFDLKLSRLIKITDDMIRIKYFKSRRKLGDVTCLELLLLLDTHSDFAIKMYQQLF